MQSATNSEDIYVDTGATRYPIRTFDGPLEDVADAICELAPNGRLLVVSDSNVASLYQSELTELLRERSRTVRSFQFPAGEASKSLATVSTLWDAALEDAVDRSDTVIAFGGGVTGDLAGFVAATILRGIALIQMPTTMLAMSDAAIGGKTGINVGAGKNLVGSFYQPKGVLCWLPSLKSLSGRELRSGMAEVIKSAIIAGEDAVALVERHAAASLDHDLAALSIMARVGAGLKADIVSQDVKERGVRSYLNLGHTFGHAIEHAQGYGAWTHGEAVAAGMVIAARYSVDHGFADASFASRVRELVEAFELPVEPPSMTVEEWTGPIFRDKKREGDEVKLILARGFGGVFGKKTSFETLERWLRENVARS